MHKSKVSKVGKATGILWVEPKSKRQRKRKRGHHERETVLQKPHLDPLEVVVQGGVHVEAVRPVREAKAQVCRLPPLHHFDHKIPGVCSADIVLLRNEQTHNKIVKESESENVFHLLESATD